MVHQILVHLSDAKWFLIWMRGNKEYSKEEQFSSIICVQIAYKNQIDLFSDGLGDKTTLWQNFSAEHLLNNNTFTD